MGATRRRLLVGAAMLPLPFVARAQRPSSITVAALGGAFQSVFQTALIDPFRRVRPNIAVYYYAVSNPAQILGLLRQRFEPAQFDVLLLNPRTARLATKERLVEPLRPEITADLIPAARLDGVAGAVAMIDCLGLPHVPEVARPDMSSWRILWDSSVVSRLALPAAPDPIGLGLTLIAAELFGNGRDRAAIPGGITALTHLTPRIVTWNPKPDVYDFLIDRLALFGVAWNGIGQVRARRNPTGLRMALPRDAPVRDLYTVHQTRTSARPEAAQAFIAYLLGPEAQSRIAESLFMTPVHPGARITPDTAARLLPLEAPDQPIIGIDSPEIEALKAPIVDGWHSKVMRKQ